MTVPSTAHLRASGGEVGGEPTPRAERWAIPFAVAIVGLLIVAAYLRSGTLPRFDNPDAPSPFAYPTVTPAPALALITQDEAAFDLSSLRGGPVLVFFGYTHCPDICPATLGELNQALSLDPGAGAHVVFASIDPERDTPASLRDYLRYMPAGYVLLTGSASAVRTTATAWGVSYARVDGASPGEYTMAHSAEVYLVDAVGQLRAHYPFGTKAPAIVADLRRLAHETK